MKNEDLVHLYQQQLQEFTLAKENYAALQHIVCRDIEWEEFSIRLQYNPARIISTNAKIDKTTLSNSKCFLCPEHMPKEQQGITYGRHYHIYINPYPIFREHFTVPTHNHIPQQIENRFEDLLNLAFDFQGYTTFYNGPECGASAPNHFHFQMAPRYSMPLEKEVYNEKIREFIVQKDYYSISTLKNYLRKVIILQASDLKLLSRLFVQIRQIIGQAVPYDREPKMNILAWFDNCQWTICIFPRKQLRPRQFFAEGEDKIMFSPGCVDMAGLVISPRQTDFSKYSVPLLTDLFRQVTVDDNSFTKIIDSLQQL